MSMIRGIISILPLFFLSISAEMEDSLGPIGMKSLTSLSALLLVAISTLKGGNCITQAEIDKHLEMGKRLFATGQLADALTHYHAAVEGDPKNYMNIFRRATVFLAMGKSKSAIPDLDNVLELKPDFTAARLQRANVKLKQGKLDEAQKDYEFILRQEPSNSEAIGNLNTIGPLKTELAYAKELFYSEDYNEALELFDQVIDRCPWNAQLHEMRADIHIHNGDLFKAVSDVRSTTRLISDNTGGYLKLSLLYYDMGDAEQSLTEIRECLKLDQDHKECHKHYKKVKKLFKQITSMQELLNEQRWDDCLNKAEQMLKTEPEETHFVLRAKGHQCHCHSKLQHINEAFDSCNEVLDMDHNNLEALMDRAETYILDEQYEKAIDDYREAEQIDGNNRQAQEGLKKAQKLLKQSQKRDYYKILGVKRNASKKEILKKYRKLAAEWHPDKHKGRDEEKAERMFKDIAAAKEVLTDPEMREKFDAGSDPLDPEEQANNAQGNPFGQGFNPFGSGGFQFKFHFN